MSSIDNLQRALTAPNPPGGGTPLEIMRGRRKAIHSAMTAMVTGVEGRDLLASESRAFDRAHAAIAEIDVRIAELVDEETRSAAAAETRRLTGGGSGWSVTGGGETYHRGNTSASFFKDLIYAQRGDADAADRLRRNNSEVGLESRALGNTGAVGGSGGEFAPPAWLVDDFVRLARAGRVTADLFHREDLPAGVSSVNLPRVATGTTTAAQTTQNTACRRRTSRRML